MIAWAVGCCSWSWEFGRVVEGLCPWWMQWLWILFRNGLPSEIIYNLSTCSDWVYPPKIWRCPIYCQMLRARAWFSSFQACQFHAQRFPASGWHLILAKAVLRTLNGPGLPGRQSGFLPHPDIFPPRERKKHWKLGIAQASPANLGWVAWAGCQCDFALIGSIWFWSIFNAPGTSLIVAAGLFAFGSFLAFNWVQRLASTISDRATQCISARRAAQNRILEISPCSRCTSEIFSGTFAHGS